MAQIGLRVRLLCLELSLSLAVLTGGVVRGDSLAVLAVEEVRLPSFRIGGQVAGVHTQELELVAGKYYVTARREHVHPERALLLGSDPAGAHWGDWDITPVDAHDVVTAWDHPGGMQSDGTRLWIPLAESKRNGRSIIRAFQLTNRVGGERLKSDFEFPVNEHIGAVAVSADCQLIFGANWDTERFCVWDFKGRLQQTLTDAEVKARGLRVVAGSEGRSGVAVQVWKLVKDRLFASGLFRAPGAATVTTESRLIWCVGSLEPDFQRQSVMLPLRNGIQLAREAMAISEDKIHFLREGLGASSRLLRVSLADLMKRDVAKPPHFSQPP
jgi:hypothetical protein